MTFNTTHFTRTPLKAVAVVVLALSAALPASVVHADLTNANFVEDAGGSARINYSGKLRMLSQRIPAAACNFNAGIATDHSDPMLHASIDEFDRILLALEHGDEGLGIFGAEDRVRTLRVIEEVHTKMDPLELALTVEPSGIPNLAAVSAMIDGNMDVLEMAKLLVIEVSGQYSNPVALRQSDAMAIDIAGRQRMLTQKISKEVCQIQSGIQASSALETIGGTINTFEVSLDALRNGMDSVGLEPPANDAIATGLDQVKANWLEVRDYLTVAQDGGTLSNEERGLVLVGLNKTMSEMNRVVGLYSEASKLGL